MWVDGVDTDVLETVSVDCIREKVPFLRQYSANLEPIGAVSIVGQPGRMGVGSYKDTLAMAKTFMLRYLLLFCVEYDIRVLMVAFRSIE